MTTSARTAPLAGVLWLFPKDEQSIPTVAGGLLIVLGPANVELIDGTGPRGHGTRAPSRLLFSISPDIPEVHRCCSHLTR